jgi:L-lysine 2,3-aminomutase
LLPPTLTWTAELGQAFRRLPDLLSYLGLEASEVPEIQSASDFPLLVPRPFASRMRKGDWKDPLLAQVLPLLRENAVLPGFCSDAVGDIKAQGAPGLLHKYGNRVLLLPTSLCAIHCRYCFRRHYPYDELPKAREAWDGAWQYLTSPEGAEVEEVILSGGDPLSLDNSRLGWFWERAVALPQIHSVRLHTRLPVVLPARIDDGFIDLVNRMTAEKPGVLVLHANHAHELDAEVAEACARLRKAGLVLLNQSVLLRGVNDSVAALKGLSQRLLDIGVLPYYLHLLDRVQGSAHFEVPEEEALTLLATLREQVQGYLVPRLVREIAGEPAKTVVG